MDQSTITLIIRGVERSAIVKGGRVPSVVACNVDICDLPRLNRHI